jgi:hypothetical protein
MFWATLGTVFITGLGLFLIARTLIHTRRGTRALFDHSGSYPVAAK